MTWNRVVQSPIGVTAWKNPPDAEGRVSVALSVNGQQVQLSEEDAASLGGYLLGTTNNPPSEAKE